MVALGEAGLDDTVAKIIGFIGVFLGAGNAAGGYVVTERMLKCSSPARNPPIPRGLS